MTLMVPHMVHLQDVIKLHTFVLGDLGALLLACFGFDLRFALLVFLFGKKIDLVRGRGRRCGRERGEHLGRWGLFERCSRLGEAGEP